VAPGHDVPLEDLVAVDCRNGEVHASERRYSIGGVQEFGLYSAPVFDVIEWFDEYEVELTKWGLWTVKRGPVTWYTQDANFEWRRYNGTAIRPQPVEQGRLEDFFLQEVVIMVRNLVEIGE
jgi:hypothetical protein